jgi:quercetin dioxygenase-like cupin family protein
LITTHNSSGLAVVHSDEPFAWQAYDQDNLAFAVPYTTSSFPPDLNNEADIATHEHVVSSGTLGLVNPRGTVLRYVDFAPGYACGMHRTQSLDYGIVLEGEVEMVLDSGERRTMRRGDVAVQRATQHQWVNTSSTEWARMMFVLQDCEKLVVAGKEMGEDLGTNSGLPPSGN